MRSAHSSTSPSSSTSSSSSMRTPASASARRNSSSTRRRICSAAVPMRCSVARMRGAVLSAAASSCAASPSTRVSGVRIWWAASRTKPRFRCCAAARRSSSRLNSSASAETSSGGEATGRRCERSSGSTAASASPSVFTGRSARRANRYPAARLSRTMIGAAMPSVVASNSVSPSMPSVEPKASTPYRQACDASSRNDPESAETRKSAPSSVTSNRRSGCAVRARSTRGASCAVSDAATGAPVASAMIQASPLRGHSACTWRAA